MYHKLIIAGHLGRDPEMRYTPDGTPVTNFSVATTRKWNNPDGSQGEETIWVRVTVWRRQAEIAAQYLSKGRLVLVEGRLTPDRNSGGPRIWTAQDGSPRASFEMTADRVIFLGGRDSGGGAAESASDSGQAYYPEEEIPF
ncbi:MAG: single-stranded DNA-binding protein [Anaerolineae bacterium]|nr:single-stranded DNA-binding protein [Anaerolineae bacterium]